MILRALALFAVVAGVACDAGRGPRAAKQNPTGSLADARAAERGKNGPRDYARAAAIYTALCQDGQGSLDACFALSDAIIFGRGVAFDRARLFALAHTLCSRDDTASCVLEIMHQAVTRGRAPDSDDEEEDEGAREAIGKELEKHLAAADAACTKQGDGRACELLVMRHEGDGSSSEEARMRLYSAACAKGRIAACSERAYELEQCEDAEDPRACEDERLAGWKTDDPERYAAAVTLVRACDEGDAVACASVPSKRIPMIALCKAHDFQACGQLGCLGDKANAAIAEANGVEANCQVAMRLGQLEARRGTLPPTAKLE
jgi:hypothetical protein